jgi:hypothetical protein
MADASWHDGQLGLRRVPGSPAPGSYAHELGEDDRAPEFRRAGQLQLGWVPELRKRLDALATQADVVGERLLTDAQCSSPPLCRMAVSGDGHSACWEGGRLG